MLGSKPKPLTFTSWWPAAGPVDGVISDTNALIMILTGDPWRTPQTLFGQRMPNMHSIAGAKDQNKFTCFGSRELLLNTSRTTVVAGRSQGGEGHVA